MATIMTMDRRHQAGCSLLTLPADVRNIIYDLVFHEPNGISIDFTNSQADKSQHTTFALALTCKEIHNETRNLPYWLNVYHFHVPVLQNMESLFTAAGPLSAWPVPQTNPIGIRRNEGGMVKQKAQDFVSSATRSPHARDVAENLSRAIDQTWVMFKLRKVHVHLGSQINHTFVERFFHAWREVEASLCRLRGRVDLRISFELRISRWLVVEYDFGVGSPEQTLAEMDRCVKVDGALTLPETPKMQQKNPALPTTSFADLNDSLDAAFQNLKLPSNNPIAFRHLAEHHLAQTVPSTTLHRIWQAQERLQIQAFITSDRFLALYGERVWNRTYADIQKDSDLQENVISYFVCLLQIPRKVKEDKLLADALLPPEKRPRSSSVPRDALEALERWTADREKKTTAGSRDEEVEEHMARITIGEDSTLSEGEEGKDASSGPDADTLLRCEIAGCDKVFSDAAAVSDHYDREHPW
ncbi:hypothetical protein PRZ48_009677 [Zasmidium cellare]|uniref:C2H2-type domain-containing protein n=1 Tax=Zasmidium cellare TaxID=395010 RepID=A0ABR0ED13_ZASCE|nr:hypothetical protein PRZ48_009677 [Zasmidium cellare]